MKRYRYGLFFLTVILGAFALYRCFADRRPDRKEPESVRIGITLYRDDDTFINSICRILETEAKKYEKTEGIRMILDVMDAKEDQNTQNSQVDRFLALGCDVICVNMVDRSAASVIIDKAMDREVPVIFFNREPVSEDLNRWEKLFYVGANPKEEGVCQGNMIADAYDACPEILDLNGDGKVSYVILEGERGHQEFSYEDRMGCADIKEPRGGSGKTHRGDRQLAKKPGRCPYGAVAGEISGAD